MSQNESFFDEVTEEIRRDRLFAFFRRWAWLAVLVVLIAVGGAAWNEWRKARDAAEAQALGDAIAAALAEPDPAAALAEIETDAEGQAVVDLFRTAAAAEGDDAAVAALAEEGTTDAVEARWSDLTSLKAILLRAEEFAPEDRIARLEPLTTPGAPYRLLALEQTAYARAEAGETDAALSLLEDILADGDVTEGLRQRASQMIVALGGSLEPA